MNRVYLGLGSNMGERELNLEDALEALSQRMKITDLSSIYETEPAGYADQPWFLNMVCRADTVLNPFELLDFAKSIESGMGRKPGFPNGPRPIDIDILFFEDRVIDGDELVVPHPRLAERAFVLVPLAEIAPSLVHVRLNRKVRDLLRELNSPEQVRKWGHVSGISSQAL
ncbi:MAG: 2-amino-4-hydroxy-6-hydroxymethyldihydropteridine diphosphokinase [Dehalococcoidia bacterium]